MSNKDQILADLQDLITSLAGKATELRDDPEFLAKWTAKNKRLHEEVAQLTPQEVKEVEAKYREWLRRERPDVRLTQIDRGENPENGTENP